MLKYELTDNEMDFRDDKRFIQTTFRQIRALRDIPLHHIKAGDLGGWVEDTRNLSQEGECWVMPESFVLRHARVADDAIIRGKSIIDFRSRVNGQAVVSNSVTHGICMITGKAVVSNSTILSMCMIGGECRVEESRLEGIAINSKATVRSSECFNRFEQLDIPEGAFIKECQLGVEDPTPYLAEHVRLIRVKAENVSMFRIYDAGDSVRGHHYPVGTKVRIGTRNPSKRY